MTLLIHRSKTIWMAQQIGLKKPERRAEELTREHVCNEYLLDLGEVYHDILIMHADGQQFTHFGNSFLHEHIQ